MSVPRFDASAATAMLEVLRWGDARVGRCPRCETPGAMRLRTRAIHKCRRCGYQFSVTTGTVFDRHKLTHEQILRAMLWFEDTGGKGMTVRLAELIGCTWKVAHVLKMRLREDTVAGGPLTAKPFLARRYWQGFNHWQIVNGELMRTNKRGEMQNA